MLIPLALSSFLFLTRIRPEISPYVIPHETTLSQRKFSLEDRYPVKSVSDVFKDNILLNMAYMRGEVSDPKNIDWLKTEAPFHYEFTLEPGKTFAFQDVVLPQYSGTVIKTSGAHFNAQEGFKSDGYLYGDGVCHLASLINWAAKDAELNTEAPTPHDFAVIPDVPKEYGVAIYNAPDALEEDAKENLYVTNNKANPVKFEFDYDGNSLKVTVLEESNSSLSL